MIDARELVERVLGDTQVDETIVIVTDISDASLRWAGNSMTTNGVSTSRRWTVISIVRSSTSAARLGTVTSSSVDSGDIVGVVRASEEAARTAETASDAMPLTSAVRADASWLQESAATDIDVFSSLIDGLSDGFDGADQLYGFASHEIATTTLGTSTGIRRRFVQPTGSIEINGKRGASSAWVGSNTNNFSDVELPTMLANLSTRLDWAAKTTELPAGRYETLLPPSAVGDLMIYLMWSMEGRGAEEGHTALSRSGGTRIGEVLSSIPLSLYSDPMSPGLEYPPFVVTPSSSDSVSVFDNGVDAGRADWLRAGAINALAYPRAAATEFGKTMTVPGDNLIFSGGSAATIEDMVSRTERGLLLTTLWYLREVDPASMLLTGLTRDGVYLVEDGEVTSAVNNFRFNESPLDLLRRTTEVGASEKTLPREWKDWFTRTAMPPIRVPDFHMSSVSQAR